MLHKENAPAGRESGRGGEQVGETSTSVRHDLARITTVMAQQPWFMRGTPEQRRLVVAALQAARQRAHGRKARVQAHPDLAARLCRSLGYARFDQWNGYVPAAGDQLAPAGSPVRAELIAILHLVVEREKATA